MLSSLPASYGRPISPRSSHKTTKSNLLLTSLLLCGSPLMAATTVSPGETDLIELQKNTAQATATSLSQGTSNAYHSNNGFIDALVKDRVNQGRWTAQTTLKPQQAPSSNKANGTKQHTRYQQYYQNIPVWGRQLVVHQQASQVYRINGLLSEKIALDLPAVDSPSQLSKAKVTKLVHQKTLSQYGFDQHVVPTEQQVKPFIYITKSDKAVLAWYVEGFYQGANHHLASPAYLVDANSGEVLLHWDNLQHVEATGPGGNQKTGLYEYGTDFAPMIVTARNGLCFHENDDVRTVDLAHKFVGTHVRGFDCSRNEHKAINGGFSPINDAHAGATAVYQMYRQWYGSPPLPYQVTIQAHFGTEYPAAFWHQGRVVVGDGNSQTYPLSTAEVMGHEIAHGFTKLHSGLSYHEQSGALSESFSDIIGEMTELYFKGEHDWLVGAELNKKKAATRYFADPTLDGHSIGHFDDYQQGMDIHFSSGIVNRAFYLLANTPGWSARQAFEVITDANQNYWTSLSNFAQGACGMMYAAVDRGYKPMAVYQAFAQVGVLCEQPPAIDEDQDGMQDTWEFDHQLDATNPLDALLDADNDGLSNLTEFLNHTNPHQLDTDNDGLSDEQEINLYHTNPRHSDTDEDGIDDAQEIAFGLNPLDATDATNDQDNDGFNNIDEFSLGTDLLDGSHFPTLIAGDHYESFEAGQLPDGWANVVADDWQVQLSDDNSQVSDGSNSLKTQTLSGTQSKQVVWSGYFVGGYLFFDFNSKIADSSVTFSFSLDDRHQLSQIFHTGWRSYVVYLTPGVHTLKWTLDRSAEDSSQSLDWAVIDNIRLGTSRETDTDGDTMPDIYETQYRIDSNDANDAQLDNDNDGLTNLEEFISGTQLQYHDSDNDKLPDGWELHNGLNPLDPTDGESDSDGDGASNFAEYLANTLPLDAQSMPQLHAQGWSESFELAQSPDDVPTDWYSPAPEHTQWQISSSEHSDGRQSLQINPLSANKSALINLTGQFEAGYLAFDIKGLVSETARYGALLNEKHPYDDTSQTLEWTGSSDWQSAALNIPEGFQQISFYYTDSALTPDVPNRVWLDNIIFIGSHSLLDTDGDGLRDYLELVSGLNRLDAQDAGLDLDNDGLTNRQEAQLGSDPTLKDSDGDGLDDGWEIEFGFNLLDGSQTEANSDTDGDGVSNLGEFRLGTDPANPQSVPLRIERINESFENGYLSDLWQVPDDANHTWRVTRKEAFNSEASLHVSQTCCDVPLAIAIEGYFAAGQLSFDFNSQTNGYSSVSFIIDGEIHFRFPKNWENLTFDLSEGYHQMTWQLMYHNPFEPVTNDLYLDNVLFTANSAPLDSDNDGLPDAWENYYSLNSTMANAEEDSDNDGLSNLVEYQRQLHPLDNTDAQTDSDRDGLSDWAERSLGTNADAFDTDGDGLPDGWEVRYRLDPLVAQTNPDLDGDGYSQHQEWQMGSSPVYSGSQPRLINRMNETFDGAKLPQGWAVPHYANNGWQPAKHEQNGVLQPQPTDRLKEASVTLSGYFAAGELQFDWHRGSTEENLTLYIDGRYKSRYYSDSGWQTNKATLTEGLHILEWRFSYSSAITPAERQPLLDNVIYRGDNLTQDTDNDGMPDYWENYHQLDANDASDSAVDADRDGLTHLQEMLLGTSIYLADTDLDGVNDGDEVQAGTDPLDPMSVSSSISPWLRLLLRQ